MSTPQPMDKARLMAMLGKSKTIMDKVESGDFESGNVDSSTMAMGDSLVAESAGTHQRQGPVPTAAPQMMGGSPVYPNMANSKMPQAIKDAMMTSPMQAAGVGGGEAFTLDDVNAYGMAEKPMPTPQPKARLTPQQAFDKQQAEQRRVFEASQQREVINEDTSRFQKLNEAEIRKIVNDEMVTFLSKYFAKSLAEDTQKKLVQQLVKEGKIKLKKK